MDEVSKHSGGLQAVLRSDTSTPTVSFRREGVRRNLAPGYMPITEGMTIVVRLKGTLCVSQVATDIYTEELTALIERLTAFSQLNLSLFYWETMDRSIRLRVDIDRDKMNDNVTCDIRLVEGYDSVRDKTDGEEEHHRIIQTNLPWIDAFLQDLRRFVQ